jgi:hypothetical protein
MVTNSQEVPQQQPRLTAASHWVWRKNNGKALGGTHLCAGCEMWWLWPPSLCWAHHPHIRQLLCSVREGIACNAVTAGCHQQHQERAQHAPRHCAKMRQFRNLFTACIMCETARVLKKGGKLLPCTAREHSNVIVCRCCVCGRCSTRCRRGHSCSHETCKPCGGRR